MSVIRVVARITPLNDASANPPSLSVPSEFGDPISVETCRMTDPRTGLQYSVETTVLAKKYDPCTDISKELSTECESVPGFVCAQGKCPVLSLSAEGDREECATLSFPKTIPQETISQIPERSKQLGPETLSRSPVKSPSLKLRFDLKKIEKERKLICARKKSQNLIRPLLKYFIEGECLICGFIASGTNPVEHLSTHIESKSYKCDCCSVRFTNPKSLYIHKLNVTSDCPYGCDICGTHYRRKHLLTVHQLKNHTEQFSRFTQNDQSPLYRQNIPPCFSCSACGERLMSLDDVYLHQKLQCEKKTDHSDDGNPGVQQGEHSNQRVQGEHSSQSVQQGEHSSQSVHEGVQGEHSNQSVHQDLQKDKCVHGKKRGGHCCQAISYQCVFCGNSFVSISLLQQHTHVRVLSQKFPCKTCAEEFGSSRALQQHQRVHVKDPMVRVKDPMVCKICGDNKKYYYEKSFLKHMRLIHGTTS